MTSTLTLTIRTGNAAFGDAPAHEVARMLRDLADRLEAGGDLVDDSGAYLRDVNGNRAGHFYVSPGYLVALPIDEDTERATLADAVQAYRSVRTVTDWPHTLEYGDRMSPHELDVLARRIREHGDGL